ncbi:hypothetical protein C8J30_11381 [Rhodobacter viridis]|uniref:Uncharacterized protein n=1 Tax=Rhodobacter viridis TaxID=1054202 RepID=A0A318TTV4_9RHOB|nr:hypothetical protein [Rhodobacter viridis]PYF08222.1 hypothetical protein C8J30_11381 [Rhodobacter viridis]
MTALPLFVVMMIDTRTEQPHRINGLVLRKITDDPEAARQEFLRHRDPQIWRIVVRPLSGAVAA